MTGSMPFGTFFVTECAAARASHKITIDHDPLRATRALAAYALDVGFSRPPWIGARRHLADARGDRFSTRQAQEPDHDERKNDPENSERDRPEGNQHDEPAVSKVRGKRHRADG
ncbi:MAG: hypothetical protein IPG50_34000 [Myxococcales bacterium]|nr:hypothetical protein [Myxococcales bacterium]